MSALDKQEGGSHYRDMPIQPIQFIEKNGLDFLQGNVVKYVTRHKSKSGAADIRKAIHYCELILQLQYGESQTEGKRLSTDPHYQALVQLFKVLDEVSPGWMKSGTTPSESASAAIRGLKP